MMIGEMAGAVSAKYAIQFGLMSFAAAIFAILVASEPVWRVVYAWLGLAFGIVAIAYAFGQPRLLMKRGDGSQPIWAWVFLWPYFLLTRFSFWLYRILLGRGVSFAEVAPGLWFARRLTRTEALACGVKWFGVLDLAAEFPRAPVEAERYCSLPLLDGAVPTEAQLREGSAWIGEQLKHGPVLVHCALGHGRTGSIVMAWLVMHGHIADVQAGIARLRTLRSSFGLSTAQEACLERIAANRPAK